ncbi:MAG: hydroxylamine oxidation protein HaoB [Nitrospira sp.]|nr:MAG: hydroxylamine oxidation protein HaoB [Nitrospira sp.]
MLAWFSYLWLKPGPAPYRYQLVEEGGVSKFDKLGLEAWPSLNIGKYEVHVESVDKPIALAYRATKGAGQPVLLNWESRISEPIGSIGGNLSELTTVATATAQHVPKEAVVLAWWDTSRQVQLLADRDTLFTSHLGQPVIVPSYWRGRIDAIDRYEHEFWGAPPSAEESLTFQRFVDALASDANIGVAMLRELAGSREAYLVVHVTDLYKLGLMRPERLDIAFKDFPLTGNVHGLAPQVKAWMKNNNYDRYTLQSLSEKEVRAYFLREGKNGTTLLAQMLPFMDRTPVELQAVQLIYNHGGYWVYKIPPAQPTGA